MSTTISQEASAARIDGLQISVTSTHRDVIRDASLSVAPAEILGIAGETGSGKSTLGLTLLGFTAPGLAVTAGRVDIAGQAVVGPDRVGAEALRQLRGHRVASVPQDPSSALNPALRLDESISEVLSAHGVTDQAEQKRRRAELFSVVGLPDSEAFAQRYPHEVSGGQLQRVAIALAFILEPSVVVMDEPTTGLDVSTTTKVARLVRRLATSRGVAIVLISHDLRLLLGLADRIAVMYQGEIVELTTPARLSGAPGPQHEYTQRLINSLPVASAEDVQPAGRTRYGVAPVLVAKGLRSRYGSVQVTEDISFELAAGACLAIVGESGSGKTTTARSIAGLHPEWDGEVLFAGKALAQSVTRRSTAQRKSIQYVFQNPYGSLNPRHTIGRSLMLARRSLMRVGRNTAKRDAVSLIEQVGLRADHLNALPHQLSGGQRQRAALARALAGEPEVLVCDEVTSSLDISVQAEVIDLLTRLQAERQLAMLFITHDLGLARQVADQTIVLLGGQVVEHGATSDVLSRPQHEYTQSLLEASRAVEAGGL